MKIQRDNKEITHALLEIVEKHFNLNKGSLLEKNKKHKIAHPRFLAIYILSKYDEYTDIEIGEIFDLDRSSIHNAVAEFLNMLNQQNQKLKWINPKEDFEEVLNKYKNYEPCGFTPENKIQSTLNLISSL